MPDHPALAAGRTAVVTGAASGLGLAAAERLARLGLNICLADVEAEALEAVARRLAGVAPGGESSVLAVPTDVADAGQVGRLKAAAFERFGEVAFLMNNAGVEGGGNAFENPDGWRRVLGVNLWGVVNGVQAFARAMIEQGTPAAIVNTGSKQGITTPPGDTAYNVSKAGVKVLTEGLQHSLRSIEGCRVSAHLFVPGFVYTGITDKARHPEKPADAWTPEQTIDFLLESLGRGDFYILCPDNAVTRDMDERRVLWAAEDIIKNRPPLSRWHPDHAAAFAAFMKEGR